MYLLAKIGVDAAENEPDVEVRSDGFLVLLILSPEHAVLRCVRARQAYAFGAVASEAAVVLEDHRPCVVFRDGLGLQVSEGAR